MASDELRIDHLDGRLFIGAQPGNEFLGATRFPLAKLTFQFGAYRTQLGF
jgi:hypothetical protein